MGNYTIFQVFQNPRRGRQARNFTTTVPKILDLKSSSEQIFSENCRWVPLAFLHSNVSRRSRAQTVKISQVRKLIPKSPRGVYFESPPILIAFTQGRNRGRCGDYNLHSSSVAFLTCLKCIFCWETEETSVDSQSHLIQF